MSNGFSSLIQADLASLTSAAQNMANSSQQTIAAASQYGVQDGQSAASFSQTMQGAINNVNTQDVDAGQKMADVDAGKSDDLVGAMLSSQEASLSFSMLMQVRNKVMGGLDELIKLPL
ncbi:flagellar hook-basal body complex protein FliE [Duganella sp. FT135W]|uniref:Flagellar hook-basal body complex protein FliE n=1 Tax=Duganella flavida TaxID=2692175 RepID=A0A6L8K4Y1_9BURK|nr:flagellar hook-basal body complex protein FliE [Duganella flavida]MYM22466.1 flagellar hook-basal body complex protein FliE [Duganella flavida]